MSGVPGGIGEGPVVVGVTGASGAVYARRLIDFLLASEREVALIVSAAGRLVVKKELRARDGDPWGSTNRHLLRIYPEKDYNAPFCSGSFRFRGMVVIPASMGTVGSMAAGISANVIHRAADVTLKEKRPLVVVPRESPLSVIHLENLLALARAGATILPPAPAFYQDPESVDDLVDFVVSRVLDALSIENELFHRWRGREDR